MLEENRKALDDKGKALDVYANALRVKEEKLSKYLRIFERIGRDVVK